MLLSAVKENLKLTLPILMTRLLGIASNLLAMVLIAKLGTEALSASALIMGIFSVCVLLVMSFSFSVCAIVGRACGSNDTRKVGNIIGASLLLNTLLALPFMVLFYNSSVILKWLNQPSLVADLVGLYFHGLLLGYLPMIWASILEQFFIGINKPKHIVYLSIINVVAMPFLSDVLMFGKFGLPALGMLGAGYAVSIMALTTLLYLVTVIIVKKWHQQYNFFADLKEKLDINLIIKLFQLGWPIALQFTGEFLAYTFITVMMGWLGVMALAAQQIILQFTTVIVMIPTSVSQTTAVLVGQARGGNDERLLKYHTNIALVIVSFFMILIALLYLFIPEKLIQIYLEIDNSQTKPIVVLTTTLLAITAVSQCFDGIRNVLAGAYRGLQETKTPMLVGTLAIWLIGIPLAYYLGFILQLGAIGLRWGYTIGILCGTSMLGICWYSKSLFSLEIASSQKG